MAERKPIFSADPKATEKLGHKVADLENLQHVMKSANTAIRKHAKAGPDAQHAALVALGHPPERARKLLQPDFAGRVGFPDYAIKNNNANIRRLKGRSEEIKLSKASFSPEFQAKADAHTAEKAKAAINDYYSKSVGAGPVFTGPDKEVQRKAALAKGAESDKPKSKQEQHADRLKTFAAKSKDDSKRAGQLLASKQHAVQTSARGAKFYVSRAGEKVYIK